MAIGIYRFGEFTLDPGERLLARGAQRLDVSSRYLDALELLLRERGSLITKDRFLDEVWAGVPVTDEALTQCIRSLRRQLGDDAARPRFIETIPKHGYRFISDVEWVGAQGAVRAAAPRVDIAQFLRTSGSAGIGGALAGAGGGLLYGLLASAASAEAGVGAISALLVLLVLSMVVGLTAGLGVGAGIAAARLIPSSSWQWTTAGGAIGGLAIGAAVRLLGLDAFALLVGRSPVGMTGPAEGALLGAAIGLAAWIALRCELALARSAAIGALAGAAGGLLVPLLGGHLLGGSLNLLTRQFPEARIRLDAIGRLLGEDGFGRMSEAVTASIEGGLFGLFVAAALALARRRHHGGRASATA